MATKLYLDKRETVCDDCGKILETHPYAPATEEEVKIIKDGGGNILMNDYHICGCTSEGSLNA